MAEVSAPQCLAPSCHIAHSDAEDAAPHSLAAAQLIQAGIIRLWKSEARLALSRTFAQCRGPVGASEPTRHANLATVHPSSRKRKATLGVKKAVLQSPSVPMKPARALQQSPVLNRHCKSAVWGSDIATGVDVAMPSPLPSPPHDCEAEGNDLANLFEELEATITTATAAAGPASPAFDLDDFEGLLGFLSEVELQVYMCP
eukprot:SM000027S09624  [mRNA]  locus=s27:307734:308802:- [translate_table: standard]